jgi:hypothetical protein
MLPVKLTDSEHLDRAKKWAKACEELALHVAEADEVKKALKAKEALLDEVQRRLMHVVGAGAEPREVLVEAWADFATNKFEEVRSDTGDVINRVRCGGRAAGRLRPTRVGRAAAPAHAARA